MITKHEVVAKQAELAQALRGQMVGYVAAALSLVAGLAWNDAIKMLIEYFFPIGQNTIQAKFVYAGLLTILVGTVSFVLLKWSTKKE